MKPDNLDTEFYAKMRILNDAMRNTGMGAYYCPSRGVSLLTNKQFSELQQAVLAYDAFTPDSDPLGAHAQGEIEMFGKTFVWQYQYDHPDDELIDFCDPKIIRSVVVMLLEEKSLVDHWRDDLNLAGYG